jgi:hypothetical protein
MNLDLRHYFGFALLFSVAALASGCSGTGDDSSGDTDADTDSDTDSDTDADADTDTDTDTDSDADSDSTISGTLEYFQEVDGATVCDASIALSGTGFTGDCMDCDWSFDMTSTVTRNDGTADCYLSPTLSTVPQDPFYKTYLGYWKQLVIDGYYGTYYYTDLLASAYGYDYYGYEYPGPYGWSIISSEETGATLTIDGDDLAWTMELGGFYSDTIFYYCSAYAGNAYTSFAGDVTGTSDLTCTGAADIWTFYAAYGVDLTVTVDTVASKTAFDGFLLLNDPSGCTIGYSDDSFKCTYPPPAYECPSVEITTTAAGTYTAMVSAYGNCASDAAAYELRIGGGSDLLLTQDNGHPYTLTISASATLAL